MYRLGTIILIAITMAGCLGPKAAFDFQSERNQVPSEVAFTNQSTRADRYVWEFGDSTLSEDVDPEHRYIRSGDYTITLNAYKGKKKDSPPSCDSLSGIRVTCLQCAIF